MGSLTAYWRDTWHWTQTRLSALLSPLTQPAIAGALALIVYLLRASMSRTGFTQTENAYFNYLADAFLHGQLHLRLLPPSTSDLAFYHQRLYLYWPPFPAVLLIPFVALFGVGLSDVTVTTFVGAITVALTATVLNALHQTRIAPLAAERRALLVLTVAFGSVVLILAPGGAVWFTAQLIG